MLDVLQINFILRKNKSKVVIVSWFTVIEKDVDEEHEYRRAAIMADIGGLDTILRRYDCVMPEL